MNLELDRILDDLSAGRIDSAEAARRIEAVRSPQPDEAPAAPEHSHAEQSRDEQPSADQPSADLTAESSGPAQEQPTTGAPRTGTSDGAPTGADPAPSWFDLARTVASAAQGLAQAAVHEGQQRFADFQASQAAAAEAVRTNSQQPTPGDQATADADASDESAAGASTEVPRRAAASEQPAAPGQLRVVVRATGRKVRIVADPAVGDIVTRGDHTQRRTNERIEVTSHAQFDKAFDPKRLLRPLLGLGQARTLDQLLHEVRQQVAGLGSDRELEVRVNPSVLVDVEVTAGSLECEHVEQLGRVRVTAGTAELDDVRRLDDLLVQFGSARVEGRFDQGRGRVVAETGSVVVHLAEGADVTLTGGAELGAIRWPHGSSRTDEFVRGQGRGRLELSATMGQVSVTQA